MRQTLKAIAIFGLVGLLPPAPLATAAGTDAPRAKLAQYANPRVRQSVLALTEDECSRRQNACVRAAERRNDNCSQQAIDNAPMFGTAPSSDDHSTQEISECSNQYSREMSACDNAYERCLARAFQGG